MTQITKTPLPDQALLRRYKDMPGAYADCYRAKAAQEISLEAYIEAFFSTPLFQIERAVLTTFGIKGASAQALRALATGRSDTWAAWQVEARDETQILMRAGSDAIRTWLMVVPDGAGGTDLLFGSAVFPTPAKSGRAPQLPRIARWLMGFHKLYSRMLLRAALRRLRRT